MKTDARPRTAAKGTFTPVYAPRRILVPVDFSPLSDEAVDRAAELALHSSGEILLIHVVEPMIYPIDPLVVPAPMEDANLQMLQGSKRRLSEVRERIASRGVKCEAATVVGKPYHQIVETARKKKADLIVLPTHGHTGLKHIYLGSTAEKVVRHAPCSVLVVR